MGARVEPILPKDSNAQEPREALAWLGLRLRFESTLAAIHAASGDDVTPLRSSRPAATPVLVTRLDPIPTSRPA